MMFLRQILQKFVRADGLESLRVLPLFFVLIVLSMTAVGMILVSLHEHRLREHSLSASDFSFSLVDTASESQVQALLSALIALPQVRTVARHTKEAAYERERTAHPDVIAYLEASFAGNPFADTVNVNLRSLRDLPAFTAFMMRPELRTVLESSAVPHILAQGDAFAETYRASGVRRNGYGAAAIISILGLFGGCWLLLRFMMERRVAVLGNAFCAGADRWTLGRLLLPGLTVGVLMMLGCIIIISAIILRLFSPVFLSMNDAGGVLSAFAAFLCAVMVSLMFLACSRGSVGSLLGERGYFA